MGHIYTITNIKNGKIYVGSSVNIKNRHRVHISHLAQGIHQNKQLQVDWNQYGSSYFSFDIIEDIVLVTTIIQREQYWIDTLGKNHILYNEVLDIGANKKPKQRLPNLTTAQWMKRVLHG
jgi:group I intron endonuclease